MSEHPLVSAYREFSPTSGTRAESLASVFPGGDTRSSAHYEPYPLVMARGEGCFLTDVDGHRILDFMNNFTSLIHGHAYGPVVEAVQKPTLVIAASDRAFRSEREVPGSCASIASHSCGSIRMIGFSEFIAPCGM